MSTSRWQRKLISILPGGGGNIPFNLNLNIFNDAIFEDSDEDEEKVSIIRDDKDKVLNIYQNEENKLIY